MYDLWFANCFYKQSVPNLSLKSQMYIAFQRENVIDYIYSYDDPAFSPQWTTFEKSLSGESHVCCYLSASVSELCDVLWFETGHKMCGSALSVTWYFPNHCTHHFVTAITHFLPPTGLGAQGGRSTLFTFVSLAPSTVSNTSGGSKNIC